MYHIFKMAAGGCITLSIRLQGMPAKRHFGINLDMSVLGLCLQEGKDIMKEFKDYKAEETLINQQLGTKGITRCAEREQLDVPKVPTNNTNLNNSNVIEKERGALPQEPFLLNDENQNEPLTTDNEKGPAADETLKAGLAFYRSQYELRTDRQPIITGADVKNLKSVVKGLSADDLTGCLDLMFGDEWYKDKGWPLKTFASQINQFIAKLSSEKIHPEHIYLDDRQYEHLYDQQRPAEAEPEKPAEPESIEDIRKREEEMKAAEIAREESQRAADIAREEFRRELQKCQLRSIS